MSSLDGFGESEMSVQLRAHDWRGDDLGAPATWPSMLRNALMICLSSSAPMQVWWGRSLRVFYNDAAIPLVDGHPDALGRSVPDVLGERWSTIRSDVDRVFETARGVEIGSCRLVPLLDDAGAVVGIVCASVHEIRPEVIEPLTMLATQLVGPLSQLIDSIDDTSTAGDDQLAVTRAQIETMHRAAVQLHEHLHALPGELAAARSEARRAMQKSKDDFLALVGHELRNPLSTISTMLQALMMRGSSSEVEVMWRAVRQLTRLVEDLLESSRLARGVVDLQPRAVELAHIVDRAMELASPWFEDKRTKVTVNVPRSGWRVEADPERTARAVSNVLMNATQHSQAGIPITVDVARAKDTLQLRIADRGSGIEPERLTGVFTSFQPQSRGSLGLGLAIARRIIELHHGSIVMKSEGAGRGTECVIELRATTAAAAEAPVTAAVSARKRLLLVEDNDDAALALKSALEQLGYDVALAHDAPIAINLARTFNPDVALLDLGLPIMDGWELAKRLRGAASDLPIVAVTARDQESDKQRSAEIGFAEHLVKPINLTELQRIVQQLSTH